MADGGPQKMLVVDCGHGLIGWLVLVDGMVFSPPTGKSRLIGRKEPTTMSYQEETRPHERWAHLRFSIVGPLLAAPPVAGQLQAEIERLAAKEWLHPITGQPVGFAVSTIERWYYTARAAKIDPVAVLRRNVRSDSGQQRGLSEDLRRMIEAQYLANKRWSYQLHFDNLRVLVGSDPTRLSMPSYSTVRRYLKGHGLVRIRLPRGKNTAGLQRAQERLASREVRSYESAYVNGLWHLDVHHGSHKVITAEGEWITPLLLGILDDHSRLVCHAQWYLAERAEELVRGLSQAFAKRGLPRALLTENRTTKFLNE
jgi:putative transposase